MKTYYTSKRSNIINETLVGIKYIFYLYAINQKQEYMEAAVNQNYIVDNYWNLLKDLSDNVKLALIGKLSSSITTKKEDKAEILKLSDFYGSMADVPFPSIEEIRDTMKDEDKDISQFCL